MKKRKSTTKRKSKARRTRRAKSRSRKLPRKPKGIVRFGKHGKRFFIAGRVYGKKGDPLDFQISAKIKLPRGFRLTAKVLTQAIRYRIDTGRNPKGIQLRIIRWRNPDRKRGQREGWRYPHDPEVKAAAAFMGYGPPVSPQQAAWGTLQNALAAVEVGTIQIRNRGTKGTKR